MESSMRCGLMEEYLQEWSRDLAKILVLEILTKITEISF